MDILVAKSIYKKGPTMRGQPMSVAVARRLSMAAQKLGTADPTQLIKPLLDRTFSLPLGDQRYGNNALTPGAAPLEPSFSELEPKTLRFTVEPLGPEASGLDRRDEATREMRRLVRMFGPDALRWFDGRSEEWRSSGSGSNLQYGAFFGTSYDPHGLYSSKVYYETQPHQIESLPHSLFGLVSAALQALPNLMPIFTTIACRRENGGQRVTFVHRGVLRLADLGPLMDQLGLGAQLPGIMQVFGLALGGRFELPDNSVLLAIGQTPEGQPEFELYVLLGSVPDVPPNFLDLLVMGLSERPRELQAMLRWLNAFTPESGDWPGNFSVLSVRTTPQSSPRVSLYLRPVEFEVRQQMAAGNESRPAA
jgi:hypothetical protein